MLSKLLFFTFILKNVIINANSINSNDVLLFEDFVIKYNRNYSSTNDFLNRFYIFQNHLRRIEYVNNPSNNFTYRLGINNFTDLTHEEFSSMYKGYNGNMIQNIHRDYNYHYLTISREDSWDMYQPIDWRAEGLVTDIKDQGQCGSCWAFSAVATMEGAWASTSGNLQSFSEQDLVDCVSQCEGCGGGWPYMAIEYVVNGSTNGTRNLNNSGIDMESAYPYHAIDENCNFTKNGSNTNITNLVRIPQGSVLHLMDALLTIGPISVAIDAEEDFQMYKSGVFETKKCSSTQLDHAVTAIGYGVTSNGKTYYIIKNSWGTDWGMDGYIYFSADLPNMCGIAQDACYAVA
jgi:C1A family cysteine protease